MARQYHVVINNEDQHSIWLATQSPLPLGWRTSPCSGRRKECLRDIEKVPADITPESLRRQAALISARG
jgi:uncharacterized protein YbdZ (MbtH family)